MCYKLTMKYFLFRGLIHTHHCYFFSGGRRYCSWTAYVARQSQGMCHLCPGMCHNNAAATVKIWLHWKHRDCTASWAAGREKWSMTPCETSWHCIINQQSNTIPSFPFQQAAALFLSHQHTGVLTNAALQ